MWRTSLRPPAWFMVASGAVLLEGLAILLATVSRLVIVSTRLCGAFLGPCIIGQWAIVHPLAGLGVVTFLGGATLAGAAVGLLWNGRRERRPVRAAT